VGVSQEIIEPETPLERPDHEVGSSAETEPNNGRQREAAGEGQAAAPAGIPAPSELGPPPGKILPTDSVAAAGRKAMWLHVDRLLRHEAVMREPEHADELRRYRVATRRLRAAIRLFGPAFKKSDVEPLSDSLAEVADVVGVVRDLDVRIDGLIAWAAGREGDAVALVQPLIDAWRAERRSALALLERRLASRRHARTLVRLVEFVHTDGLPASIERPGHVVRDRAGSGVWLAFERVREFAPSIRWADTPTLHRLRIQAKRLRYSLEFLGDVLGPDRPWLVERLVALQDHLGALNDATVTAAAVRAFLDQHQARLSPAERGEVVAYLDDRERQARTLRRSVGRPWRAINGITFARRLARTALIR
jgi:triphosphatase